MYLSLTQLKAYFPKIFRIITERGKGVIIGLATIIVFVGVVTQVHMLSANRSALNALKVQHVQLTRELAYWQDVARQYPNYRDVLFRIASLQYELGQKNEAQKTLQKVLSLDPNFKQGNVLGAEIKAH